MNGYGKFHQDRVNLVIHLLMVPVFVVCALSALRNLFEDNWSWVIILAVGPFVSLAVQAHGHKKEINPPVPFKGGGDFLTRILVEQFYTFPRFLLSGGWLKAWRSAPTSDV